MTINTENKLYSIGFAAVTVNSRLVSKRN